MGTDTGRVASMNSSGLGNWLRLYRQRKGLKLREVAKLTGFSISYLSDMERDRCDPSLRAIEKITRAMGYQATLVIHEAPRESLRKLLEAEDGQA
jgi:transcriptional regulator with XRE-family HTH domain